MSKRKRIKAISRIYLYPSMQDKFAGRNFDAKASRDEIDQSAVETERESRVTTNKGIAWFLSRPEVGGDPRTRIPTDWPSSEKERERERWKQRGLSNERARRPSRPLILQQPTAACIMQVVGNGRTRNVCRADAASGVNLMRPAQKEREPSNEWPNERCTSGLRDFPEEISKYRRPGRAPIWTDRFALGLLVRSIALSDPRRVKSLKYCDNVTRACVLQFGKSLSGFEESKLGAKKCYSSFDFEMENL